MKEKCLIDTSLLLKVILEGEVDVLRKISGYVLYVPVNVLEETSSQIIISSVLELTEDIFENSKEVVEKYRLLPNDALIAATCKHHGIRKIATFDHDFKRVDFLEIITPE